jgi:HTH-type transcriptional regulator, competence development regulator
MRKSRSAKVNLSVEARVLREMRVSKGLSMRAAGALIGRSDSYISQIENGRMEVPVGPRLQLLLNCYGPIKEKSFYERTRTYKGDICPMLELGDLALRLTQSQIVTVIAVVKGLLAGG